jgi:plasmid stabilization system protein ParE
MIYTVIWKPLAEQKLASIWIDAQDRQAVSAAANEIDRLLRVDPQSIGESRSGSERVLIVEPLVVAFEVEEDDRRVSVLSLRFYQGSSEE